jgi:integrase
LYQFGPSLLNRLLNRKDPNMVAQALRLTTDSTPREAASPHGRKARDVRVLTKPTVDAIRPSPDGKRRAVHDGKQPGLVLVVAPSGAKSWYLFARVDGAFEKMYLGAWPVLCVDDARKAARTKLGEVASGDNPAERRRVELAAAKAELTFGVAFEKYLAAPKRRRKAKAGAGINKSPATLESYRGAFDEHLAVWSDRKLGAITRPMVVELFDTITTGRTGAEGRRTGGPYVANRCLALIRAVFNFGTRYGFIGKNPAAVGDDLIPNEETPRHRIIDPVRELPKFLEAVESESCPIQRDAAMLALQTGQRTRFVCGAEWSAMDSASAPARWTPGNKGGGTVVVDLNDDARAILKARAARRDQWVRELERERVKLSAMVRQDGQPKSRPAKILARLDAEIACVQQYVFPSPKRGARFRGLALGGHRGKGLKGIVARISDRAGMEDLRGHDLRRTFGSYAVGAGVPLSHVARSMGHANSEVTEAVYAVAWREATARAADGVQSIIRGATMKAGSR